MLNPSDFQKIRDNRDQAVDEVNKYLREEENWLLDSILQAFHISAEEHDGVVPIVDKGASRFSAVIDAVMERIDLISEQKLSKLTSKEFDVVIAHINAAFRHYEEILEGCAAQLFHELEKIRVDELSGETLKGVLTVKDHMIQQVDDCISHMRRLERKLGECADGVRSRWSLVASVSRFFRSILDRSIVAKLKKIKQMVSQGYAQLQLRYGEYQKLNNSALVWMTKLDRFQVFHKLPADKQQEFTEIYRLVKVRELNKRGSDLLGLELDRILKETISVDQATRIFDAYFQKLEAEIYSLRRDLTQCSVETLLEAAYKSEVNGRIQEHRREVHLLGSLILKFRDFVLSTHPDPYVRARLGFSERTVGPEPEDTKSLMQLGLRVEALDKRYSKLSHAVEEYEREEAQSEDLGYFDEIIGDLERLSWEAKTREEAQLYYQTFLVELQEVQELYSFDRFRVMGMEKVLRLALRLDHFHVLVDERKLCELYETHTMIRGPVPNMEQRKRLKELIKLNQELTGLRTSTAHLSQSARSIASKKADEWAGVADALLGHLEDFIQEERAKIPLSLEELLDRVMKRRYEILEFLFSYHSLMSRLYSLGVATPPTLGTLMDRVHKLEGDFAYLSSHHERVRGPMKISALKALESL